jgi:hypothetical protein
MWPPYARLTWAPRRGRETQAAAFPVTTLSGRLAFFAVQTEVCCGCEQAAATWRLCHSAFDPCVMTLSGGRGGGCDEDKDLVGGAIGRDIVGCRRGLLAPQREGTIGCSASLRPIGEKRARRGHNPGTIGSNTASAEAYTDASTAGPGPTARATDHSINSAAGSDTPSAGAHTDASTAGPGPTARATDHSINSAAGSDTIIPLTDTNAG